MHFCIDAREFTDRRPTGISRYLENLLAPILGANGIAFSFLAADPSCLPESFRQAGAVVFPSRGPAWFQDQVGLPRLMKRGRFDLLFSPHYTTPLRGSFKRIVTIHDIPLLRPHGQCPLSRRLVHRALLASARRADSIHVDSEFTRREFLDLYPGADGKTRVLSPRLDPSWALPVEPWLKEHVHGAITGGRPFFLYVGRFKPHKNVDALVDGFLAFRSRHQGSAHDLILAGGDARNLKRIEDLCRASGAGGAIHICRNLPDANLRALYAAARWFITASSHEGFSYPVLEAMAMGCPVICHPCSSLPEIVGDAALSLPEASPESIAEVLECATRMLESCRLDLVSKARGHTRRFLSGHSSRELLEVMKSLCCR